MHSGVARAFPGGQVAHPENQLWGRKWRKFEEKWEKIQENEDRNILILPTWGWEVGYGPAYAVCISLLKLDSDNICLYDNIHLQV